MRYGIFADAHGNIEALETVLEFYRKEEIDKYIFAGDAIGYGPNPRECLAALSGINPVCIAGNHDWAMVGKVNAEYFNVYARRAITWTRGQLSEADTRYLESFILTYEEKNFICVHASLKQPERFSYIYDSQDARINFDFLKKQICFVGHSHRREVYAFNGHEVTGLDAQKINLKPKTKYIVNVGSVGQPRDGDPRACSCIYDSKRNELTFSREKYNIGKTAEKILNAGLPTRLATRLYEGR